MKPDAKDYLAKSAENLDESEKILNLGLFRVAARSAFYAAFHAAEAYIVHKTGQVAKSYGGVRTEFARLSKAADMDRGFSVFMAKGYKYKELGDYGVGQWGAVDQTVAATALRKAKEFVSCISNLVLKPGGDQ